MKPPVDIIFSPVEPDKVPYWRLVLRGCSQLCFQTNELTGLFFLAAVLVASPISAAYLLVAGIMAPAGRLLLAGKGPDVASGLPGLNPCLVALALPAFFQTGWLNAGMWAVLIICVAVAIVLVRLCLVMLGSATLVVPFIIIFWALYAIEPHVALLQPIKLAAIGPTTFLPLEAVARGLGQALFAPTILSGLLYLAGISLSNWRHGVIALSGAIIGTVVSYYYRDVDPAIIDTGLYGFNGVSTAVAVFIVCGGKLRLAILGALLATILIPAIADFGVPAVSAPFVLTTWLMLALGWIERKWFDVKEEGETATGKTGSESTTHPQ
jgi:urea transporter